jgi:hypothetical protein
MKVILLTLAILAALLGGAAYLLRPRPGPLVETTELTAGRDRLRYEVYEVKQFMGGSLHLIKVQRPGEAEWRELLEFTFDDPRRARETNFRLAPLPGGAYGVLLGWKLALSPGPGREKWVYWDAGRDLAGWECCNEGLLRDVSLNPDGTGHLELNPIPHRGGETARLITRDHGASWRDR